MRYILQILPGNLRAANVGRFKIAPDANADAGIIAFVTPVDGDLSSTETVEVVVRNFGTVTQSNIEVSFTLDGWNTRNRGSCWANCPCK